MEKRHMDGPRISPFTGFARLGIAGPFGSVLMGTRNLVVTWAKDLCVGFIHWPSSQTYNLLEGWPPYIHPRHDLYLYLFFFERISLSF